MHLDKDIAFMIREDINSNAHWDGDGIRVVQQVLVPIKCIFNFKSAFLNVASSPRVKSGSARRRLNFYKVSYILIF